MQYVRTGSFRFYSHALQRQKSSKIKINYKILMLFLDQNFTLFRMVHFVFL
jgi:hypothetical protein